MTARSRLAVVLIGSLGFAPPAAGQPDGTPAALQTLRKRLGEIRTGITAEQVRQELGPPDEVRPVPDGSLLDGTRYGSKEAPEDERWAYGPLAKGAFARVGIVSLGADGRVVTAGSPDWFAGRGNRLPARVPARDDGPVETGAKMTCRLGPVRHVPGRGLTMDWFDSTVTLANAGPAAFELKHDAANSAMRFPIVELCDAAGTLLFREDKMTYHSPRSFSPAEWPVLTILPGRQMSEAVGVGPCVGFGRLPAGRYGLRVYFPFERGRYYPSNLVRFELTDRPGG